MADTKISQLPESTLINQTDILPVVINPDTVPENRKVKASNILTVPTSKTVLIQQSTTPAAQSGKEVLFADTSDKLKYVKPDSSVEELTTQTTFMTEHNADGTHLKATGAEVNAGTDDTKIVTPYGLNNSKYISTTKVIENNEAIIQKDSAGNLRNLIKIGSDDFVYIGDNNLKGFSLATKIRAYAYNSGDYTLSSMAQKIRLDSKVYDPNNNFDIVNYKYIVPYTGLYLVSWSAFIRTNDWSASFWGAGSFIRINNINDIWGSHHYVFPNANAKFTNFVSVGSFLGIFNQNDYIELWGLRDNYTAIAVGGEKTTYLSIILLALT